jgi:hypothetical protein
MTVVTPVWVWLPGRDEPMRAGEVVTGTGSRFIYRPEYLKTTGALALDPVELRLSRSSRGTAILGSDGLPGVIRDAKVYLPKCSQTSPPSSAAWLRAGWTGAAA